MKKALILIGCILICLLIGAIGGIATASGVTTWYTTLNKPFFNPPNYLFGPVWTLLYLLMGISIYLVITNSESKQRKKAVFIFILQLFLNFWWSFIFFKFQCVGIALIEIIIMWTSILYMIIVFRKVNKPAAYLQIPYLMWVSFATILNASIYYLN